MPYFKVTIRVLDNVGNDREIWFVAEPANSPTLEALQNELAEKGSVLVTRYDTQANGDDGANYARARRVTSGRMALLSAEIVRSIDELNFPLYSQGDRLLQASAHV